MPARMLRCSTRRLVQAGFETFGEGGAIEVFADEERVLMDGLVYRTLGSVPPSDPK